MRRMVEDERLRNFGFERVERLAGNVGYLDLRMFSGLPEAQATAVAAMNFLANADAIIVDLRRNGGGDPSLLQTVLTYFIAANDRLHINDFYMREGDRTEQWWSAAQVPGPRLNGKPLYVLTSNLTGSCAEEFAYDVQTHKLGTLYGASTAGGANPGGLFRLSDHLAAFIATGRAINPVTKTNWEGVGVKPDRDVPPGDALREAHLAALQGLLANTTDADRKALLERAIERAKQDPSDPAEEFMRGPRRRTGG
jgi:C-terminal processing protease CtpA/Prc